MVEGAVAAIVVVAEEGEVAIVVAAVVDGIGAIAVIVEIAVATGTGTELIWTKSVEGAERAFRAFHLQRLILSRNQLDPWLQSPLECRLRVKNW